MFSTSANKRIYRISAWYDLFVTWPFAIPITLSIFWGSVLMPFNTILGLQPLPILDSHAVLFGNFFGSLVVVWALVRLYLDDLRLAIFDGGARVLFSVAMINALMSGVTPLVWGFLIPELAFAVVQLLGASNLFWRKFDQ